MKQLIEPAGRPHVYCTKCRVAVVLPVGLSAEARSSFVALVRAEPVEGMRFAEANFGFGPREAKVLVLHTTREPGKCNCCGLAVPRGESVCSCRAANLDW